MKSLVDLKKELKEGKLNNLYIFTGEENLIRKIYYEKISEINGPIRSFDTVSDLYKDLEKKSLFTMKYTYLVYNDTDFLKQKEKVYNRLLKLCKNKIIVLVFEEIPEKGPFREVFEDYITVFNKVTDDIACKYVHKQYPRLTKKDLISKIAFNCFNSYNYIVEEMNKYKHLMDYEYQSAEENQQEFDCNDDAVDAMRYFTYIFNPRKLIPTPKEFANAFVQRNSYLLAEYYLIIKENNINILGYLPELYNTITLLLYLKMYGKWDGASAAYNAGEYWGRIKELRDLQVPYNKNDLLDIRYLINKMNLDIRCGKMKPEYSWDWLIGVVL